jgi:hypothetical protein
MRGRSCAFSLRDLPKENALGLCKGAIRIIAAFCRLHEDHAAWRASFRRVVLKSLQGLRSRTLLGQGKLQ